MCGIVGIFNYKNNLPVSVDLIKKMNKSIIHRGPDDEGFYIKNNIGLGMRRLSIIDLQTGHQPISNENKSVWVVFNGEIYNYIELRKDLKNKGHNFYTRSDTEVIVHLYEEYGPDFPLHINGMYAIALWDEKKKTVLLVRDRPGIKPLYYAETENGLMFASEIKALLKAGVNREIDLEAINQYLAYGYIPSPLTGFKRIRKLNPGHILICTERGYSENEFWDIGNLPKNLTNEEHIVEILIGELKDTLNRQTRSDVPLGIFLSGGIDSALIASVAVKGCGLKPEAFTIGFREESYNELDQAKIVTKRLGITLNKFILSESDVIKEIDKIMAFIDEPLFDYSAIPLYFVSKLARAKVKTVVGGEGGDELFGGYQTHYLYKITGYYRKMPYTIRNIIKTVVQKLPESHKYLSTTYKLRRFTYGSEYPYDEAHYRWKVLFDAEAKRGLLTQEFLKEISEIETYYIMEKYFIKARRKGLDIEDQLMYVDFKTFLQDDPLQKTDRMSMANSLEVRVPLLDNAIIDFSERLSIPKIKRFKTKYLLRKALSRFQPKEIAFGKKKGFTPPLAVWIKKGLKDYVFSVLSRENIKDIGFLRYDYITKLFDEHLNNRAENSRAIWSLVVLVKWYQNYVNG